jgi:polyisoprenoid-binding protein YceI
MKKIILVATTAYAFAACTDNTNTPQKRDFVIGERYCSYAFSAEQTEVAWQAYKFTEKVGVNGKFDKIDVDKVMGGDFQPAMFKNATFSIPIASINTANPDRDMKIQKFFFGSLKETTHLKGEVKEIMPSETNPLVGKMKVKLNLNAESRDVEFDYTSNGDKFGISAIINVNEWNAQTGINKLNEACYELHKGADGSSMLWPEVKLNISTILKTNCL